MAVTIAGTAADLNTLRRDYDTQINQLLRQGLEIEQAFTVKSADRRYVAPNVSVSEVVQPYQWQFTPKGNYEFNQVATDVQPIKIDFLITEGDLEQFFDAYYVEWFESGKDPVEWAFPRYIYEEVAIPKIYAEMDNTAWNGEYAAPTAGTAGLSINSVDGYKKKIVDAITAGDLTEYATGALVASTIVNQIEGFCDGLPAVFRDLPGTIYMSPTNARKYGRNYRETFGFGVGLGTNQNTELRVDYSMKTIKGLKAMEGNDGILFFPASTKNAIYVTRRGYPTLPQIVWERHERSIKGMATFYRGYGFKFWDHLFVNDQFTA